MSLDDIDSAHPDAQRARVSALVKESLHMTSTLNDYYSIVAFAFGYPDLCYLIPDGAYTVLIIQCFSQCKCTTRQCTCMHGRKWLSNFEFLVASGKLHLVKEVRIIINNRSPIALGLDIAFDHLRLNRCQLPSVELLVFLGPGLFSAGKMQDTSLGVAEATLTLNQIATLYPNIINIQYCIPPHWGPISKIIDCFSSTSVLLFEMLLARFLPQLISVQAIMPFPDSIGLMFSRSLTCLSLNTRYVRYLQNFPRIPVRMLRKLDLMQVEGTVDWNFFLLEDQALKFPHLRELSLEFAKPDGSFRKMPTYHCNVLFPSIKTLKVQGMKYSAMNFASYFEPNSVPELILYEDPSALKKMSFPLLKCSSTLYIVHLDGLSHKPVVHKCSDLHPLFNYMTRLETAKFTGLEYPLPVYINWKLLRWLYFTASIANRASIENLLSQLPCLETLIMPCFSMNMDDVALESRNKNFDDQLTRMSVIDTEVSKIVGSSVSDTLARLDIISCQPLMVDEVAKLAWRLPRLTRLGVNPEFLTDMILAIMPLVCDHGVLVREFSPSK